LVLLMVKTPVLGFSKGKIEKITEVDVITLEMRPFKIVAVAFFVVGIPLFARIESFGVIALRFVMLLHDVLLHGFGVEVIAPILHGIVCETFKFDVTLEVAHVGSMTVNRQNASP